MRRKLTCYWYGLKKIFEIFVNIKIEYYRERQNTTSIGVFRFLSIFFCNILIQVSFNTLTKSRSSSNKKFIVFHPMNFFNKHRYENKKDKFFNALPVNRNIAGSMIIHPKNSKEIPTLEINYEILVQDTNKTLICSKIHVCHIFWKIEAFQFQIDIWFK